jgi:CheY-like chemotaxis protein
VSGAIQPAEAVRVLVVDDQLANRALLAAFLSTLPVEVTMAEHGAYGVEVFQQAPFDAILMDIRMPVMDGITAVRAIRAIERQRGDGRRVPIAMITSESPASMRQAALGAGADDYLEKPIDASKVLQFIDAARAPRRRRAKRRVYDLA